MNAKPRRSHIAAKRNRLVVGVVQAAPAVLDLRAALDKAAALIAEAGRLGCRLLVFPETWIPCYPIWCDGGTLGKWDHPPAKRLHARLWRNSLALPSPECAMLSKAARRARVAVIMGINEREVKSGTLYNSLVYFSETGEVVGRHRKLIPTFGERLVWGQGDGSGLRTHTLAGARVGGLICWEHWMPLARQVLHAEGEQIHAALWPQMQERHQIASRHYAFEGRCYVLAAASYVTREMFPADFELPEDLEAAGPVLLNGGSAIIGPNGEFLAGPILGKEQLLTAEIDLDRILEEQQALDVAGHYSRPDIFDLTVDRRPRTQMKDQTADDTA